MPAPENHLKKRLLAGELQLGCWLALVSASAAEIAATAGFDWYLIDAEHGPNGIGDVVDQLRALKGYGAQAVVRTVAGEDWQLKQVLDAGAQTVVVPMVQSADEAAAIARAVRYAPEGTRGLGAGLVRASGYNHITDYAVTANDEICLIVQAESRAAIEDIDAIAATKGVDAVFIGPADLAADMGHIGDLNAPEVQDAIAHALARIRAAGKIAGILAFDLAVARRYADAGAGFIAVGGDVTTLANGLRQLETEARRAMERG